MVMVNILTRYLKFLSDVTLCVSLDTIK
jgi:hypothetical protein